MSLSLPDTAGLIGSVVIAVAYIGNLQGRLRSDGATYSLLNLFGAVLILTSLWWRWNLAAALMELFWSVVSLYALVRAISRTNA